MDLRIVFLGSNIGNGRNRLGCRPAQRPWYFRSNFVTVLDHGHGLQEEKRDAGSWITVIIKKDAEFRIFFYLILIYFFNSSSWMAGLAAMKVSCFNRFAGSPLKFVVTAPTSCAITIPPAMSHGESRIEM